MGGRGCEVSLVKSNNIEVKGEKVQDCSALMLFLVYDI